MEEVEVMSLAVDQIVAQEEMKSGLVIVKAVYGKLHGLDLRYYSRSLVDLLITFLGH